MELRHCALYWPQSNHFGFGGTGISLGDDAYKHALRDSVITHDPDAERIVRKVGERIAAAANKPEYKWDFTVINDPDMVNAFAVPGGKVAAYTGIFGPARDEAGLAVVLGHEVAHAWRVILLSA